MSFNRGMNAIFYTPYGISRTSYSTSNSMTGFTNGNSSNNSNNSNNGLRECLRNASIGCALVYPGGSMAESRRNASNCLDHQTRNCLNNH